MSTAIDAPDHSNNKLSPLPTLPPQYANDDVAQSIFDKLTPLFEALRLSVRSNYIGEEVSQLEHGLQAAHFAAKRHPDNSEFIIAGLLHDIGHTIAKNPPSDYPFLSRADVTDPSKWMGKYGAVGHERIGARYLEFLGFSRDITQLVGGHVDVKRYRTAVDPAYHNTLSAASQITLRYQGGPMNADEVANFERDPLKQYKIELREVDEEAKVKGLSVPPLDTFVVPIIQHIIQQRNIQKQEEHKQPIQTD
jgi:predicted HD phosphohydrolase